MWWQYLVVFLSALAVDSVPFFAPPAWTVMVLLMLKWDLNPWIVLVTGVLGSTLGRYFLGCYIPRLSNRFLKSHKNDDLEFLGKKLSGRTWRSWLFVFIYSLTPLSTTALFTAAGIAKIKPVKIIPPFFLGKFVSDAVMLFTGRFAVTDLVHGTFSPKSILSAVIGLLIVSGLLFIDWRTLLQKKKLRLNFRIWRRR